MTHPTIKIDTNVAIKRGPPDDTQNEFDVLEEGEDLGLEKDDDENVPPFLCQSGQALAQKFLQLNALQEERVTEAVLSNDPFHRWAVEDDFEIKARNRYPNVQPWANSRIHLRVPDGECDYINASPIVLQDSITLADRRYIAAQGPTFGHLPHFWHMVFHESGDVAVIVMLTQTIESGKDKCAQYFPLDSENPSMLLEADDNDPFVRDEEHGGQEQNVFGEVTLVQTAYDEKSRSEIREFELRLGSETKTVWHFLFAGWPDHTKPEGEERQALIHLIKLSGSKCGPDNPRIVHCSAGVGRTGTFIALDHLVKELESGQLLAVSDPEEDPVYDTVSRMRDQRMMMIVNLMQWQFVYEVLREQTDIKLGKNVESSDSKGEERSAKMAKLSNESDDE